MTNTHLDSEHDLGVTVVLNRSTRELIPYSEEILRVSPESNGSYRVDCVPWFTYGINFGDIIRAEEVNGNLQFVRVIESSGHSTFRIRIDTAKIFDPDSKELSVNPLWTALTEAMNTLNCRVEICDDELHSIDVPADAKIDKRSAVLDLLMVGRDEELFDCEEATYPKNP